MNTASLQLASWTRSVALATAVIGLVTAVPANGGESTLQHGVPQVVVKYADLNIDRDEGALALYRRIAAAARIVCPDYGDYGFRDLGRWQAMRACREQAMARAVDQVGSVRLAAIHASRTRVG